MTMDAIREGCHDVVATCGCELVAPPRHVRTVRKQRNHAESHVDDFRSTINVPNRLKVYEVWSVVLNDDDQTELFIVISARCTVVGNVPVEWSDVAYRGFFASVDEAMNQVEAKID